MLGGGGGGGGVTGRARNRILSRLIFLYLLSYVESEKAKSRQPVMQTVKQSNLIETLLSLANYVRVSVSGSAALPVACALVFCTSTSHFLRSAFFQIIVSTLPALVT